MSGNPLRSTKEYDDNEFSRITKEMLAYRKEFHVEALICLTVETDLVFYATISAIYSTGHHKYQSNV